MNILFSCDEYPPAKTGGIGSATKIVCEALAAKGHNVYVVSGRLPGHNLPYESSTNGVTIYRLTYFTSLSFILKKEWAIRYFHGLILRSGILCNYAVKEVDRTSLFIERIIREKKIDIIEIPDYTLLDKYYLGRKLINYHKYSVPSVCRVHGSESFLSYNKTQTINSLVRKNNIAFFDSCDHILAVSKFSAQFVNDVLGIKHDCDVIYNPLDTSFIEKAQKLVASRENNIVFLGKVIETKGAFNLLKAFEKFILTHNDFKLIMIGGGQIEKAKSLITPETLDKVEFTGYLSRDKIAHYLKTAAFCVIPSFYENFSVAALEVMGCGNILIYTNTTSGPETISDGVDGFLVDPHDINAIAEKMVYVADNLESLVGMRQKAFETIETNFKQNIITRQLEKYYLSICNK